MKKILLILSVVGLTITATAQNYKTAADAARGAQEACGVFGQKAKAGSPSDYTGVHSYGSSSSSTNSKEGGQNVTKIGAEAGGRTPIGKLSGDGSFTRYGEKNNSSTTTKSESQGHLYYKCE